MVTIDHPALPSNGRLICGPRPQRTPERPRPFGDGVAALVERGVSTIACLLDDHELPRELIAAYETAPLEVVRFPIADFGRPADSQRFVAFLDELLERLRRGETVYLHCYAGIGRTGTVLACLLARAGADDDPVRLVRAIYNPRALETEEQQRFARLRWGLYQIRLSWRGDLWSGRSTRRRLLSPTSSARRRTRASASRT